MKADDLKGMRGRRVLVEGVIFDRAPEKDGDVYVGFGGDVAVVPHSAIREILPEEVKVGDRVRGGAGDEGRVLAIDGELAWVRYDKIGYDHGCSTDPLCSLTVIE